MSFVKQNLVFLVLGIMFILFVGSAFLRYIILQDYLISYHTECQNNDYSCFVECLDDNCQTETFYLIMEKNASDLIAQCGESIEDCAAATKCLDSDQHCKITQCTPKKNTQCSKSFSLKQESNPI